jgi:site-specific recombinase XerD
VGFNEDVKFEYKINGKVIKKTFKKWELISSHTARRSFITNAVKRDANLQYIKRASGHKSGSSFDKYVLLDR